MAAMAEIPRNRRRWVLPAALVVVGVLMMVIGSFRPGDYASAVWLQLGSALAPFGLLYGAQPMLERGITEVRRQGRETRASVDQLSHEIAAIRDETAAGLDDLRRVTLENVEQRRRTDEDAFRRFKEEPTFENVTELINQAQKLGGISKRGVRVQLPGTSLRSRFPLPAGLDRFSRRELQGMQRQANRAFDSTTSLPSVLWQSGLLGYVEQDGEAHFYSQADMDQFDIPMDADDYVFHPSMIDSVRITA
jgi:hypothetical protein